MDPRDQQRRTEAVSRIKRRRAFWVTLTTYAIMNAFFIAIWALTGAGYFWPGWVLVGWGLGLAFSAVRAFGPASAPRTPSEQQVEEEMRKMRDRDAA